MDIANLLGDKTLKPKQKVEKLSSLLLSNLVDPGAVIQFAVSAKESPKATCIEALEFATKERPALLNKKGFEFVSQALTEKAPRVKWESAKVIANTASLHKGALGEAVKNLLQNTEHEGTVVRWSAALALGEILKLETKHRKELLPAIEAIIQREEKDSIRKIYMAAIKKIKQG